MDCDIMCNEPTEPVVITLPEADWERFVEVLENPPEPNAELKALLSEGGARGDNKPFTVAE
jgi:uncharacterized protein (DUF1778 family)